MNLSPIQLASVLAGLLATTGAQAANGAPESTPLRPGLQELADAEMAAMRGRYTLGGNAVAWFGVTLVSQWQTAGGTDMQAAMRLGFDLRGAQPKLSYQPSVHVVSGEEAASTVDAAVRQVDSAGLANVDGLVQSVQLAGDGSQASNVAMVRVRSGDVPGWAGSGSGGGVALARDGQAQAEAWADGQRASIRLQLAGQGEVRQWLGQGQVGQSVALSTDGSWVSNQLQLEVVRAGQTGLTPLAMNVAQAIGSSRGLGVGGP